MTDRPDAARQPAPVSPFRPNLEQQKTRAKELLRALRAADPAALRRYRRHHPRPSGEPARLSDAQLVIARELGVASWPKLKAHILAMDETRRRIARGGAAPDADIATLHIRCGSDIEPALRQAGFGGDFLEYSDPLCQGPVVAGDTWLARRIDFVTAAYGPHMARGRDQVAAGLRSAEAALKSAADRFERVVLWFEHDSYDQLILARCLAQFRLTPPRRLEFVLADAYPGSARYIGLGQLPPEALALLWRERRPVPRAQLQLGEAVWRCLRSADPTPLAELAASGLPDLPQMARALRRHCQELPWLGDGLSLTERLVLQLAAERARTTSEVFTVLTHELEPLPWLGDTMLRNIIERMSQADQAPFRFHPDRTGRGWWGEKMTLTDTGQALLAGKLDWMSLNPPDRWVGGVRVRPGQAGWRWDDPRGAPILA